jgi:hypothetical protein
MLCSFSISLKFYEYDAIILITTPKFLSQLKSYGGKL